MIILKYIVLLIFLNQKVYCTDEGDTAADIAETPIIPLVAAVQSTEVPSLSPSNTTSISNTTGIVNSTETANNTSTTSEKDLEVRLQSNLTITSTEPSVLNVTSSSEVLPAVVAPLNSTERIIPPIATCPAECKCAPSLVDAICTGRGLQDIPHGFSSQVKMLILTSNNITEIGENCFKERNLFELMSLLMNHNRISILHPNAFVVLKHLEVLDLGDNRLTVLSPDLFVNNMALTILRLDNNTQLQIPESGALINAPALHDLNISSCNISFLPNDIFSGTPLLDTIDLSGNNLKELNPLVLKTLPDLIAIILPKSFEPKSHEICLAHEKLEKIVISNKGYEENIECGKLLSNASLQISEIIVPPLITVDNTKLQNNYTGDAVVNSTAENIIKVVANLSSGISESKKVVKLDTNSILSDSVSPQNIQNDNARSNQYSMADSLNENEKMEVRLAPTQNQIETSENKMESTTSQGLSGSQIDNIIIGILLTIITVTGAAIIINLNKSKIDAYFKNRQRRPPSRPISKVNEFEIEPLKSVVANE
ncbi:slit homolog 3 protein-like [Chrysoperla carnea]|uniref:slit homolog 3 protein-like n=1 Tax=Chrysoperla carnea TaxID=189513 RepID=UPI001D060A0D|nr:slit homolog 3 protein-like [Chrysoperla carnea]